MITVIINITPLHYYVRRDAECVFRTDLFSGPTFPWVNNIIYTHTN